MGIPVRLENVVIVFPVLWEPRANTLDPSKPPKWSASFLLDPVANATSVAAVDAAYRQVLTEAGKLDRIQFLKSPMGTGDEKNQLRQSKGKDPWPWAVGKRYISANTQSAAPAVVDQHRRPISKENSANLFGGCIVNAYIDLYWSNNQTNPGCFVGLQGVQLVSNVNVERVGAAGPPSAEEMFDVVPTNPAGGAGPAPWE